MNCFFHPDEVSAASCIDCGKYLCQPCAAKYKLAICDACNTSRSSQEISAGIKKVIPTFLLFVGGFVVFFRFMAIDDALFHRIIMGVIFGWILGGLVWGMIRTRKWFYPVIIIEGSSGGGMDATTSVFRSLKLVAWFFVSLLVGPFIMPVDSVKLIIAIVKAGINRSR